MEIMEQTAGAGVTVETIGVLEAIILQMVQVVREGKLSSALGLSWKLVVM